jgi:alginate O-acetyltransferase complex protein AlgJ
MKSIHIRLLLSLMFIVALFLPGIQSLTGFVELTKLGERRTLNSLPAPPQTLEEFTELPDAFSAFYRDHFGFREILIRINNLMLLPIEAAEFPGDIIKGKADWFFFKPSNYIWLSSLADSNLLAKTVSEVEMRIDRLESMGIDFRMVIIPNKGTVYPEYLPDQYNPFPVETARQKFLAAMSDKIADRTLDLTPLFIENKTNRLFEPADFHWNFTGARLGSEAIADFLQISASLPDKTEPRQGKKRNVEFARMLSLSRFITSKPAAKPMLMPGVQFKNRKHFDDRPSGIETYFSDRSKLPRILVFHDSFGEWIRPYLAHLASEIRYVWTAKIDLSEIEVFQPDVVIQLFYENNTVENNRKAFVNSTFYQVVNESRHYVEVSLANRKEQLVTSFKSIGSNPQNEFVFVEQGGVIREQLQLTAERKAQRINLEKTGEAENTRVSFIYQKIPESTDSLPFSLSVETGGRAADNCVVGLNGGVLFRDKGYNVYHLSRQGLLNRRWHFNTSWYTNASNNLANLLNRFSDRAGYVLLVSRFDGARKATPKLQKQLESMGSKIALLNRKDRFHILLYDLQNKSIIAEEISQAKAISYSTGDFKMGPGFEMSAIRRAKSEEGN